VGFFKYYNKLSKLCMCINGCALLFLFCTGSTLCAVVSLRSIEVFKTHEWLKATTTVYFLCKGESKTVLLDVRKSHVLYAFSGEESWQVIYTVFSLLLGFQWATFMS